MLRLTLSVMGRMKFIPGPSFSLRDKPDYHVVDFIFQERVISQLE